MVIIVRIGIGIRPKRAVVIDARCNGRDVLVRVIAPRNVRDEIRPVRHDDARQAVHRVIAVVLRRHERFARYRAVLQREGLLLYLLLLSGSTPTVLLIDLRLVLFH